VSRLRWLAILLLAACVLLVELGLAAFLDQWAALGVLHCWSLWLIGPLALVPAADTYLRPGRGFELAMGILCHISRGWCNGSTRETERETGFEPATYCLEGSRSRPAELLPLVWCRRANVRSRW
jgi:hypothetical protein